MNMRALIVAVILAAGFISSEAAAEPGWWGVIIAKGTDKARIQATPIINRPYRPLHFYGNTVRRRYYRGETLPRPKDFVHATQAFFCLRELNL